MKCANCGAEIKEGNLFCSNCGKETQIVPDYNVFEDEYLKTLLEESHKKETESLKQSEIAEEKAEKAGLNKRVVFALVISALLVVAIILGSIVIVTNNRNANSVTYQMEHADAAREQGDYATAIEYYNNVLRLDSNSSEARMALASIYMTQKDYDSAYVMLKDIIRMDADNVDAYKMLINLLQKQNKIDDIIALSEKVTDSKVLALFADYIVTPPTFSVEEGTYEAYFVLELKAANGFEILYTLDGSDPKANGKIYTGKIDLEDLEEADKYVFTAVCVNANGIYSNVVKATYIIDIQAPATPVVSPDGGSFKEATKVTITVPEGCVAYYTWDGSNPSISSSKYEEPIEVPEGDHILAVIIRDEKTEKFSTVYRGHFTYYADKK